MGARRSEVFKPGLAYFIIIISLLPVAAIILDALPLIRESGWGMPRSFTPYLLRVTGQTLMLCATVTILSLAVGIPSGYFLARIPAGQALVFTMLLSIPLASPSLVSAIMVRALFEKTSWLAQAFSIAGFRLPSVYGFSGLLLTLVLHTIPYTILMLRTGFLLIPRTIPETARSLGAQSAAIFLTLRLPYVMPQILTSCLMILVYTLGDLGAPLILGGGYKVFASEIYTNFISNWGDKRIPVVFALWSILVFAVILVVLMQLRRLAAERSVLREQEPAAGPTRTTTLGYFLQSLLTLLLLAPFVTAVPASLLRSPATSLAAIHDYSSVKNTFLLVLVSVPLMLGAGIIIANTVKTHRKNGLMTGLVLAPAVLPGVLLGFGLLNILYALPALKHQTPALLGMLVLAMVLRGLPYVVLVLQSAINPANLPQEDSARSLGASSLNAFLSVTLPHIRPVVGMAAVVGLFMCVTELSASLVIYPPGWQTMALYIAYYLEEGLVQRAMLMAFLLLGLVELTLALASFLSRKSTAAAGKNPFLGTEQGAFLAAFTAIQPEVESSRVARQGRHLLQGVNMAFRRFRLPWRRHIKGSDAYAKLQAENEALRRQLALAEQKSLRMQINPHFFFNTLNTIVSLLTHDPQAAAATIGKLSALFRYSLDAAEESSIFLPKEIEYIRTYLEIEKLRFGDALAYSIEVPPELYSLSIPPMLLQPLIENAIKYGKDEQGHAYVHISARKEKNLLYLRVADYGLFSGEPDEILRAAGTGVRNVMQRLAYLDAGVLAFRRNRPHGVIAELALYTDE